MFWNIMIKAVFHTTIAFVNDLLIMVKATSLASIKGKTNNVLTTLGGWCIQVKPTISASNTIYVLMKGNLQRDLLSD